MKHLFFFIFTAAAMNILAQTESISNHSLNPSSSSFEIVNPVVSQFMPMYEDSWFWDDLMQEWELALKYEYIYENNQLQRLVYLDSDGTLIGDQLFSYDAQGRIDTITSRFFDAFLNEMVNDYRNVYSFDQWSNPTFDATQIFNGSTWDIVFFDSIEYVYFNNGLFTQRARSTFVGGELISIDLTLQTFDENARLTSRELQNYIDNIAGFAPVLRYELEYDLGEAPSSFTEFLYNSDMEDWTPINRYTALAFQVYNSFDDYITSNKVFQVFDNGNWFNVSKSETSFDGLNSVEVISVFQSGFWLLDYQITKTFDAIGLPTLELEEFRIDGAWRTEQAREFVNEYEGPDNKISRITIKEWDDKFQSNQNVQRRDFGYMPTSLKNSSGFPLMKIFPNPVSERLHIQIDNVATGDIFHYELIDRSGRSQLRGNFKGSAQEIQLEGLSEGLYFLIIEDNKGLRRTEKLIVE
jgi:hypothetical protein